MSLHWIRGARGFVVAVVLATAVPAAAQSIQPTAPIAINEDVFNGTVKGFLAPDEVLLSTKLSSAAFTGFFRSASASAVAGYMSDPADIPSLQTGDVIKLGRLRAGRTYAAIGAKWPAGSVIVAPVVAFEAHARLGTVRGFATLRIEKVGSRGNLKYLDARVVALDPPTLGQ